MVASVSFFPVGCGDMTLVEFYDGMKLLIDVNIRVAADHPADSTPDVASELRRRLKTDAKGRPYVDAFLLSHPDQDHCRGFEKHFHVGPLADYADDNKPLTEKRIVIRELWSSPLVFRRRQKNHVLCSDASVFNAEARRRVRVNRDSHFLVSDGDRIRVLGEDINGKTDDLQPILTRLNERIATIAGKPTAAFSALLLGPLPYSEDESEEEALSKNDSSVALNLTIHSEASDMEGCNFLTAGDAEVGIWERQWARQKATPQNLAYDLLQAPHHCSWHSLSWDSWSELREGAKVSRDARLALGQAKNCAFVVASSKPVKDDDCDPPCIRAKREYASILRPVEGTFFCTGEYPNEKQPKTLTFAITKYGVQEPTKTEASAKAAAAIGSVSTPRPHG